MQITPRFYVTQIRNAAHTIGVPLPPTLTKQLDQADALVHAAETMVGISGDLNSAILDALEAGRDYHNDPAVQRNALDRMIANFQSHGVTEAAQARAMSRRRAALVEHADDILAAWADAIERHSAALAAAAAKLPTHDLADTATIIAAGLDAVQHWNDAQHAIRSGSPPRQGSPRSPPLPASTPGSGISSSPIPMPPPSSPRWRPDATSTPGPSHATACRSISPPSKPSPHA
ncbi:hypothetical protein [Mycolicibacterium hippocampi]|uniref:Uncharacterized protein n=1 Tax=Mycolicibacterium hippocampi TaxID=659824 RepID=A0A7I9ZP67_9MYCO|nr:hypothetical protein [Mycolicibacterium hippocampi]GFH02785.1 hypothetical protein MHIP_32680 [Mycolicibacterium hippocampi]